MIEEWRNIKGYEGLYEISNFGRVKSLSRYTANQWSKKARFREERILSFQLTKDGYPTLKLNKDGKTIRHRIHRLVAFNFLENPQNKPQVNHKDGIKINNFVENLEWNTQNENQLHACINGLKSIKLTENDILEIRKDKRTLLEIGKDFNIAFQTVSEIKNRKIWKWVN